MQFVHQLDQALDNAQGNLIQELLGPRIAIVGGGRFCLRFLETICKSQLYSLHPQVVAVADINPNAPGLVYAATQGIHTTTDYKELFDLPGLTTILEITNDIELGAKLRRQIPGHIQLIEHYDVRTVWDLLRVEIHKASTLEKVKQGFKSLTEAVSFFSQYANHLSRILVERHKRARQIEIDLIDNQRVLSQIIEGSTIPTFVIDQNHVVTHWNRALEKLTGFAAAKIVGTTKSWLPFWQRERPTMADVILDQISEEEIRKLYGQKWKKSVLIEGAYEAEIFFPNLGENGKWCWFTAAPIKAPDGKIIGAIETLWDTTEDKRAEQERERHTREQSTLVAIYSALNSPEPFQRRLESAMKVIRDFIGADTICIFLKGKNEKFYLQYSYGAPSDVCQSERSQEADAFLHDIALNGRFTIIGRLNEALRSSVCLDSYEALQSVAFIPIFTKGKTSIGVIRIGSREPEKFSSADKPILELIGNRIGVAVENAMLQEQVLRSEKKYRSLFNNDPNPIFILDKDSLKILDTNHRAQDHYGYNREEMMQMSFLDLGDKDDDEIKERLLGLSEDRSILLTKKKHFKKNGMPIFVNINVSQAKYGDSEILIASTTDVTETVEKETQLIQASKMTTLGLMAAGMAHEINQPLNVIQICADYFLKMVNRGKTIPEQELKTMAMDIIDNVARATSVIKHVRDFARQSEINYTKIDINDPIRDVFKVLGHQLKVHQVEVELALEDNLPPVLAEHNRLEQVFINLVTNAIDAMDEKAERNPGKHVEKKLTIRSSKRDNWVVVEVSDTGIGMSEDVQNKIFEPFFTTKKVGKGTGLGVSISYGILKDYNATISVDSHVGEGTTFTIKFPSAAL